MIHSAIMFAATAHNGQVRKGTPLPYIIHPLEVAQILSKISVSEDIIVAGILHDVLEDTNVSLDDLRATFGHGISITVQNCSFSGDTSWKNRRQCIIQRLSSTKDINVVLVLCADKISNLRSIIFDLKSEGETLWNKFSVPKEDILWYYDQLGEIVASRSDIPWALKSEYSTLLNILHENTYNSPISIYPTNN